MSERRDKVDQLERTILELGAEIFRLKTELSELKTNYSEIEGSIKGLREYLDDKGIIMNEDFETTVQVNRMLALDHENDHQTNQEMERLKKSVH